MDDDREKEGWLYRTLEAGRKAGYSTDKSILPSYLLGEGLYSRGYKEGQESRRVADEVKRLTTPVENPRRDIPLVKPHLPLEDRALRNPKGF